MNTALVSIIIVNWNGLTYLPNCFKSLHEQRYKNIEILFIDNASSDSSVTWVRKNYPKTKILVNEKNTGFAEANNRGYMMARGKFILFLNNDTIVTKDFLTKLIASVDKDPKIGGAQSKMLLMDKPDTLDSIGAFLTPTGFLYHFGFNGRDKKKYDREIDLYTAKGACMLFRKTVLDSITVNGSLFDPRYFAYFEETDMCHRVWLAGYRIVYAYPSVIFHKMGATSSLMDHSIVQFHSFKNRMNSYMKNLGFSRLISIGTLHCLLAVGMAWYSLLKRNAGLWLAIHKAIWWNIIKFKETLRDRRYIQTHIRQCSDIEFLPRIMRYPGIGYYLSFLSGRYDYEE